MKNYEITEEQIKELAKGNAKVKNWFPGVFETKLEVGKTITYPDHKSWLLFITEVDNEKKIVKGYGFGANGIWMENAKSDSWDFKELEKTILATDTEVLEALTNEAKKMGLVDGAYFIEPENCNVYSSEIRKCVGEVKIWNNINTLCFSGSQSLIFKNGIWATPIKTYTKEEAEKMLNAKII